MRTPIPIAAGYYVDESQAISTRECVNLYPHIPESETITDRALFGISGTVELDEAGVNDFGRGLTAIRHDIATGPTVVIEGNEPTGKAVLLVQGEQLNGYGRLVSSTAAGITTYPAPALKQNYGTIPGNSRTFMAYNGTQVCIVAPDQDTKFNAYIFELDGSPEFQAISDTDFDGPASSVCYSDGYFIFSKKESNQWFVSNLRDGLTYTATDFASAESDPDYIRVVAALRGIVFVFGETTLEQWQNVGGAGFPYERINSGTYNVGCEAPNSVVEVNNSLLWIGGAENEEPGVWACDGGLPQKISTASIETVIFSGGSAPVQEAFSFHWAERGHSFVAFTVPGVCTVVYDLSTGLWHERKSVNRDGVTTNWRLSGLVNAFSQNITSDLFTGKVGDYSSGAYYEFGDEIHAYFTTPPIDNGGMPFSVYDVELVAQVGTVPITGQGSDPVIRMSISKDGGVTYFPEISRKMGKIGEYRTRIHWPCLGRYARSITLRWDISEPIKRVFVKAEADIGN